MSRTYYNGILLCFLAGFTLATSPCSAQDEFTFDLEEFEKKNLEWGGYTEFKWEHMDINQGSAFSLLNFRDEPRSTFDRYKGTLQIDGSYSYGKTTFNWILQASGQQDDIGWYDTADVFEAYASLRPSPLLTASIGKKSYKWGKGYAWNPVGFLNRLKDPNNPEEALEGYITAELDLIKSFSGSLQTVALTVVALPVWDDVNDDFGEVNNVNLAAKLYFLYKDTDIDLIMYTGNSRSRRYGLDFSKNLATNFEIHGELSYTPDQRSILLDSDGTVSLQEDSALSGLIGIRYLSENDITSIIEYYHNDAGYTETEMDRFYQLIEDGGSPLSGPVIDALLDKAREISLKGYGRPQPGRNYIYGRFTKKEPFDFLYLTPGLTTIFNLDDESYSISPEVVYTGFTNWELRMRFTSLQGSSFTEYGEKMNSNKLEFRVRYFF
ncbi:MAG: hypothetical protein GQ541_06170 [Desulfovibrionaceae bacterium]|nr:hypothetical protein [Desulfovibrionaceae bacterium]